MKKILLGTSNMNKLREVKEILEPLGYEIISMKDVGLGDLDVVEDGDTFEANALKKAREIALAAKLPVLADDSGLAVDYLNGAPGVYSARYSGENATSESNNAKLLKELDGVPQRERTARFVCALAYVDLENEIEKIVRGEVEGQIIDQLVGENGFGYDPLFYVKDIGMTFAQADADVKNNYSHRGRALVKMREFLESLGEK